MSTEQVYGGGKTTLETLKELKTEKKKQDHSKDNLDTFMTKLEAMENTITDLGDFSQLITNLYKTIDLSANDVQYICETSGIDCDNIKPKSVRKLYTGTRDDASTGKKDKKRKKSNDELLKQGLLVMLGHKLQGLSTSVSIGSEIIGGGDGGKTIRDTLKDAMNTLTLDKDTRKKIESIIDLWINRGKKTSATQRDVELLQLELYIIGELLTLIHTSRGLGDTYGRLDFETDIRHVLNKGLQTTLVSKQASSDKQLPKGLKDIFEIKNNTLTLKEAAFTGTMPQGVVSESQYKGLKRKEQTQGHYRDSYGRSPQTALTSAEYAEIEAYETYLTKLKNFQTTRDKLLQYLRTNYKDRETIIVEKYKDKPTQVAQDTQTNTPENIAKKGSVGPIEECVKAVLTDTGIARSKERLRESIHSIRTTYQDLLVDGSKVNIEGLQEYDDDIIKGVITKYVYLYWITKFTTAIKGKAEEKRTYETYGISKFGKDTLVSKRTKYGTGLQKKIVKAGLGELLQNLVTITKREYKVRLFVTDTNIKNLLYSLEKNTSLEEEVLSPNTGLKPTLTNFIKGLRDEETSTQKETEDKDVATQKTKEATDNETSRKEQEKDQKKTTQQGTPGSTDTTPGSTDTPPGSTDTPPGSTDTTPGSTDTTPGSTDSPPTSRVSSPDSSGVPSYDSSGQPLSDKGSPGTSSDTTTQLPAGEPALTVTDPVEVYRPGSDVVPMGEEATGEEATGEETTGEETTTDQSTEDYSSMVRKNELLSQQLKEETLTNNTNITKLRKQYSASMAVNDEHREELKHRYQQQLLNKDLLRKKLIEVRETGNRLKMEETQRIMENKKRDMLEDKLATDKHNLLTQQQAIRRKNKSLQKENQLLKEQVQRNRQLSYKKGRKGKVSQGKARKGKARKGMARKGGRTIAKERTTHT
jgi:hypothetical protein